MLLLKLHSCCIDGLILLVLRLLGRGKKSLERCWFNLQISLNRGIRSSACFVFKVFCQVTMSKIRTKYNIRSYNIKNIIILKKKKVVAVGVFDHGSWLC